MTIQSSVLEYVCVMLVNRTTKPKQRWAQTATLVAAWNFCEEKKQPPKRILVTNHLSCTGEKDVSRRESLIISARQGCTQSTSFLPAWWFFAGLKLERQLLIVHFSTVIKMLLFLIMSSNKLAQGDDMHQAMLQLVPTANTSDIITLHTKRQT